MSTVNDLDREYLQNKFENVLLHALIPPIIEKIEGMTGKPAAFSVFSEKDPSVIIVSGHVRFRLKPSVLIEDRALHALIKPLMKREEK